MSDVCTGVFAKRRVVPEDVVALSVFTFACFGWFVLFVTSYGRFKKMPGK